MLDKVERDGIMAYIQLIQGDVEEVLEVLDPVHCIFADVPDNIGLGYATYKDDLPKQHYVAFLQRILNLCVEKSNIIWCSFNSKWIFDIGHIICSILNRKVDWEARMCIQTFTFGQNRQTDLTNCYRPLLRLKKKSSDLYPDAVRIPSWRLLNGDPRADPRGKVATDVMDFPRVTGNSKQRRTWHPTQINEGLIEQCLKLTCKPDDVVLDLFSGTGTTLRVCRKLELPVIAVEIDKTYCEKIAEENGLEKNPNPAPWSNSWHGY